MSQQNIYDNEVFFEEFKNKRTGEINYNDLIETPILHSTPFWAMIFQKKC